MLHETKITHNFVSDDGRLGIFMEMEGSKVTSVILTKKGGPKAELSSKDIAQLAEVAGAASIFIETLSTPEVAAG